MFKPWSFNKANALAYAAELTGGHATYAAAAEYDGMPVYKVRVRMPDYHLHWVTVWDESGLLYGEY